MSRAHGLVLLLALVLACAKSTPGGGSDAGGGGPKPSADPLTGVWEGPVNFVSRTATFRFTLVEDAGTLFGYHYVNDPENAAEFHMVQPFDGNRSGNSVQLRTPTETITATLDGGFLVGVDPVTQPSFTPDAGQQPKVIKIPFSLNRISRDVVLPDAGDYR